MKQRSIQNERAAFDQIFKAVGDPHRLKIIELLAEQELNAGELLQSIDIVQSTLSHHMKCLVESGIVNARRNGKWTCYTLNTEVIHDAYDFLGQYLGGTKKTGTGGTAAEDTADSPDSSANSGQPSAPQDGEGPAKMKKKGSGAAEDEKKKRGADPQTEANGNADPHFRTSGAKDSYRTEPGCMPAASIPCSKDARRSCPSLVSGRKSRSMTFSMFF
jgi:ArsR family transcriptional regulator